MDTGTATDKTTGKVYMYRADPHEDGTSIFDSPVRVWDASGGGPAETMTTREFNARYRVQYRFDTSRVPG